MSRRTKKKNEEQKKKKDVTRRRREKKRWRRRRRRKENPSTLEKRASSLGCESRTCAKPALTAKLPFSTSVFPLILSTSVYMCTRSRARVLQKVWRFAWKFLSFFFQEQCLRTIKRMRIWQLDKKLPFDDVLFFLINEHSREDDAVRTYQYVYGCVYEVVRKMDDGRLASVVVYNLH